MGLESVELVWEWEKYFSIKIPDREAEKIYTVQDSAKCIIRHIILHDRNYDVIGNVYNMLTAALVKHGIDDAIINPQQRIFELIAADDLDKWKEIEKEIHLSLPHWTSPKGRKGIFGKMFSPQVDITPTIISRFAELICVVNYETLIDRNCIQNPQEVLLAVMGVACDKLGIDPFEIEPGKSYTSDLGID